MVAASKKATGTDGDKI